MIQLVPTIYENWNGDVTEGYQYSVTTSNKYLVPGSSSFPLPGVFIKWDISPFVIQYVETGRSFAHLLTRLCAITGGTFVVLGTYLLSTTKHRNSSHRAFSSLWVICFLGLIYGALSKTFPVLQTVRNKAGRASTVRGPLH